MTKIVYVTGCLGFIGYAVTLECLKRGWYVCGVDKETYAANVHFLSSLKKSNRFKYIKSDINDLTSLFDCDAVINTAAETHVDNSIIGSDHFLQSNVNGVKHLLELVHEKRQGKMPTFIQFSTDEVYGDIVKGKHAETDMLRPSNPYSATKAAADMLVTAWGRTYNIPYVIVRPTNNYGIGQYVEKLIPKTIKAFTLGRKIELHDKGKPVRTWLHVDDTARAVAELVARSAENWIFNITSDVELENIEVVERIARHMKNGIRIRELVDFSFERQGQDVRYSIDDSRLRNITGWTNKADFQVELANCIEYYTENFVW